MRNMSKSCRAIHFEEVILAMQEVDHKADNPEGEIPATPFRQRHKNGARHNKHHTLTEEEQIFL